MCVSEIYRRRPVKNRNMEGRGVEEMVQGQKGQRDYSSNICKACGKADSPWSRSKAVSSKPMVDDTVNFSEDVLILAKR